MITVIFVQAKRLKHISTINVPYYGGKLGDWAYITVSQSLAYTSASYPSRNGVCFNEQQLSQDNSLGRDLSTQLSVLRSTPDQEEGT